MFPPIFGTINLIGGLMMREFKKGKELWNTIEEAENMVSVKNTN
jgi:hypothetical protein